MEGDVARGDFSSFAGAWTISGDLAGGGTFDIKLTDKEASIALPLGDTKLEVERRSRRDCSIRPAAAGCWRAAPVAAVAVGGPSKFGAVGLSRHDAARRPRRLVDVLVGTTGDVECQFMFDRPTAAGRHGDVSRGRHRSVRALFRRLSRSRGPHRPGRIEVRYGDNLFAIMTVTKVRVEKGEPPNDATSDFQLTVAPRSPLLRLWERRRR